MSEKLEVTYDVAEVDGLTEAREIVGRLKTDVVYCDPAWRKMKNVAEYIEKRQREVLAETLADPEKP